MIFAGLWPLGIKRDTHYIMIWHWEIVCIIMMSFFHVTGMTISMNFQQSSPTSFSVSQPKGNTVTCSKIHNSFYFHLTFIIHYRSRIIPQTADVLRTHAQGRKYSRPWTPKLTRTSPFAQRHVTSSCFLSFLFHPFPSLKARCYPPHPPPLLSPTLPASSPSFHNLPTFMSTAEILLARRDG